MDDLQRKEDAEQAKIRMKVFRKSMDDLQRKEELKFYNEKV
jgi:hypothetical protein